MIQLNLLYVLFWIPPLIAGTLLTPYNATLAYLAFFLVGTFTAGPATAGAVYVLRNFATESPVFLVSDFFQQFKQNYKQSALAFFLNALALFACYASYLFYGEQLNLGFFNYVFKAMVLIMALLVAFETFHVFLMIVTVDLKLKDIFKNCFLFAILNVLRNFCSLLFAVGFLWLEYKFFPLSMFIFPFIGLTLPLFIITFNAYPVVKKYAIDPYYETQETAGEDGTIFED
ncbi:MAG: DUF624 domain-containing protein [Oscillospiraceae bacterium]|nr:DUF624 domain-containing protein [Oscillospiraceae bacterium]